MSLTPEDRQQFHQWLIEHDLRPGLAAAILETMPPFDWSNIARRDEMLDRFASIDRQFTSADERFTGVDTRLNGVETRLNGVETRLNGVETRLSGVETRLNGVETRLSGVETRLNKVEDGLLHVGLRIDALNHTLSVGTMGLVITLVLGFSSIFTAILLSA